MKTVNLLFRTVNNSQKGSEDGRIARQEPGESVLGQCQEEAWHIMQPVSSKADGWYEYPKESHRHSKTRSSKRTKEKNPTAIPCVSLLGPQRGRCYIERSKARGKDSAPGWVRMTAAGKNTENTVENSWANTRKQEIGIFR